MGWRALEFSRAHPDASPGYTAALARLEERLNRAKGLAAQQRDGIIQSRTATLRKQELRRSMKQAQIKHLASVAKVASEEIPGFVQKFVLPKQTNSYLAFLTAARGMEAETVSRKELLAKHGLSETVLQGLTEALNEFEAVSNQGSQGRAAHIAASFELDAVADEVVQVVKVMDGLNRFRFARDGELLRSWEAASDIVATPQPAEVKPETGGPPPAGGEVRPAA